MAKDRSEPDLDRELPDLPPELHGTAASLERRPEEVPAVREALLRELEAVFALETAALLDELRERDALRGRPITWAEGSGTGGGIDGAGRLVVELEGGGRTELGSGEVHLGRS